MLSEDYAEIVDDEGDYSTPAGKKRFAKCFAKIDEKTNFLIFQCVITS